MLEEGGFTTKKEKEMKSKNLVTYFFLCTLVLFVAVGCSSSGGDGDADTSSTEITDGDLTYAVVDTGQTKCYDDSGEQITCPAAGEAFYGQDAQFSGSQPNYTDNGDGTVTDNVTGLMWQQVPVNEGFNYEDAVDYCESLELAGYDDWRIPTTKELFSISDFLQGWPYLDTTYFSLAGESVSKDEQYWTERYVGTTEEGQSNAAFGVNHGTGHIKAYPAGVSGPMGNYVRAVRGNTHGVNDFEDNGDGTVTDHATGLMWAKADSGEGMDWEVALAYAENSTLAGYGDWRLPNVKELQSIVDYTRSPSASNAADLGPAINMDYFEITELPAGTTNYETDYGYFWSSTSAYFGRDSLEYYYAWYVAFGTAVSNAGNDSHGAGGVRFDTKVEGGSLGEGGERYYNYVRLVRGGNATPSAGDEPGEFDSTDTSDDSTGTSDDPADGEGPDLAAAAAILGVTEAQLQEALGDPAQGQPDFTAAAAQLGVTEQELMDALEASTYEDDDDEEATSAVLTYPIVDTNQGFCYDNSELIDCPAEGEPFYGQDAQYAGTTPSYTDNGDGTVTDNVTGLVWTQDVSDYSMPWSDASGYCESLTTGGITDWRLPNIKELWSIRDFSQGWPWVDTDYFYLVGDGTEGAQQHSWSSNYYLVDTEEAVKNVAFIVNDWTGHIKALDGNRFVRCVCGDTYGINDFVDNGDGTITDNATGLMWEQDDSGEAMNWEDALAYAEASTNADYDDWRLPNVKELQSLADYSGVLPAMDSTMFNVTGITNEAGNADYPYYLTGTTNPYIDEREESDDPGYWYAWYFASGYAVDPSGNDTHGAGAVRFDTKLVEGPDGIDAERGENYVRLVRGGDVTETPDGDPSTVNPDRVVEFEDGDTGGPGGPPEDSGPGGPPEGGDTPPEGALGDTPPEGEGGPDFSPGVEYLATVGITVTAENLEAIIGGPPAPTASEVVANFAASDVVITEVQAQALLDTLNLP